MADLKNELFNYLAHRHFDLMPPDVHDRFQEWADNGTMRGNMKEWNTRYNNPLVDLTTTMTTASDWEKLYDACQQILQKMDNNKAPSFGYGSDYNGATRAFIEKYFGDNTKTFTTSKATSVAEGVFTAFENWLRTNKGSFQTPLTAHCQNIFTSEYKYDDFLKDIRDKKYNTDESFRNKLEELIGYVRYYQQYPDPSYLPVSSPLLPAGGVAIMNFGTLPQDPKDWYEIPNKTAHIGQFKTDYREIFDTLLTDATIRKHFLAAADGHNVVKKVLETAIAKTDYENKESDDYVPPMPMDEKNWRQKIKKWKDDTYENHFRRFTNPSRGTRVFFSPHSQNIMKALDKAGVKPTDGLDGILSKKDDSKIQNVINQNPDTRKHFDWFVKTMETIKKEMPDAYAGALKNGEQLQTVVMRIIATTKKDDIEKAKTALEVLSVAKYGLVCSNRLNKLYEATKGMSILSDGKLSWNKNEGIGMVTKAIDEATGLAIRGVATAANGVYNFIQHRRTKIGKNISKYKNAKGPRKNFYDAYKKWEDEDTKRHNNLRAENTAHLVDTILTDLDNPARLLGIPPFDYKTHIQINSDNIDDIKSKIETARSATPPSTTVTIGGVTVSVDNLQYDVDKFDDAYARKQHETNWREENPDVMSILVAHWNMLETTSITHSFTLGSMALKRKDMFKQETNNKTHAQNRADAFRSQFYGRTGHLRAA